MIREGMSIAQVGAVVCTALENSGIQTVLSGGAVVSIYSNNAYQSFDLDFIRTGLHRSVDSTMEALGFAKQGRHWTHPLTEFAVECLPGPVMVGEKLQVRQFNELRTEDGVLRLLAPTECVMDRLAWYYWGNDPQALDQAIAVALAQPVDIERIEAWSRNENASDKLSHFMDRLASKVGSPA